LSKFSDRLSNLGQTAPARLGFGKAAARDKTPVMLVVARTDDASKADGVADAAMLPSLPSSSPSEDSLWGVEVTDGASLSAEQLKESKSQFVLVESEQVPASVLTDEDLSKGLVVQAGLSDSRIRAIEDSPFEFLLYRPASVKWPLTVAAMLELQEVVSNFSKHIFLELNDIPGKEDLEVLKQLPVSAIVVDLSSVSADSVKTLKETIAKLEPRKQRNERGVLVPASGRVSAESDAEEDYDDDWDDED
jgi:hypothetical protein